MYEWICIVFTFFMHLCAQMPRTLICALMGECHVLLYAHLPCVLIWPREVYAFWFMFNKSDFNKIKRKYFTFVLKGRIFFDGKKIGSDQYMDNF